jgi:D-alanine transaminase
MLSQVYRSRRASAILSILAPVIVHLNGRLLPLAEAHISPLDRGFLFGDGIYEGLRAITDDAATDGTRIVGRRLHAERMDAGLREAGIGFDAFTLDRPTIDLLRANNMREAFVYWQVTAGTPGPGDPPRHRMPPKNMTPTVFGYCAPQPPIATITGPLRKRVVTCPDMRWHLGHVKSISLMGNVWAAKRAQSAGADEAIMVRGSLLTEGLATNVLLVVREQGEVRIVTPSLDSAPMLAGVTRRLLLDWAPEIVERPVHASELETALEVMLIGTTTYITSCTHVDGRPIHSGEPGPVAHRLASVLLDGIRAGRDRNG